MNLSLYLRDDAISVGSGDDGDADQGVERAISAVRSGVVVLVRRVSVDT